MIGDYVAILGLMHCCGNVELHFGKPCAVPQKLHTDLLFDSTLSLLGICPEELKQGIRDL